MHNLTTDLGEECPPLNAISLAGNERNLHLPCQFGSIASHEVAQSRLPYSYRKIFDVVDTKEHTEWSLIGGKGSISPFHVDSDGLGTVITVHMGSKYWVFATQIGGHESLCSVDSVGGTWDPYIINEGDNVQRFRLEGVHLREGDMV